jgi:hypothetical protein
MGLWQPGPRDTCPASLHDRYSVVGPDGLRYPTWHPPTVIDPATGRPCTFGHEHGRDPAGSDLAAWIAERMAPDGAPGTGGIPFGYANQQLDVWNAARGISDGMRHEDHVGHKIEWENDVVLHYSTPSGRVRSSPPITCDWLIKVHQGTHSADAFTNNTHEILYFVRCDDGTEIAAAVMSRFGAPGQFLRSCERNTVVSVGPASPPNSQPGGGMRFIPDRTCITRHLLVPAGAFSDFSGALYEDWISANYLRTPDGRVLAYFDPHFAVFNPSRYFDPGTGGLRRTVDACWEVEANGDRARGGECTGLESGPAIAFDDPRSPFDGSRRETYFNQTTLANAGGPTTWYTDPFGGSASPRPFPGAIRQHIGAVTTVRPYPLESQAFGADRPYGGSGVHAPN